MKSDSAIPIGRVFVILKSFGLGGSRFSTTFKVQRNRFADVLLSMANYREERGSWQSRKWFDGRSHRTAAKPRKTIDYVARQILVKIDGYDSSIASEAAVGDIP